eukprot:gene5128-6385_t
MISNNNSKNNTTPKTLPIFNILFAAVQTRCLQVCLDFEIAKRLSNGPKSCVELGKELNVDAESLNRVLRVMSSVGAFVEIDDMVYENNDVSLDMIQYEYFCKLMTQDIYQEGFKRIGKSVKEGCVNAVSFDGTGLEFYDFVDKTPEFKKLFHTAMESLNSKSFPLIANKINFNEFETIVDIGGSQGHLLLTILEKHNQVKKAINFDLPTVIEKNSLLVETRKNQYSNDVLSRFEEVGGSFFDSVPLGDIYLLRNILHNWSNEKSKEILSTISKAMKKDSKIYIFEHIINSKNVPNMMVAHCGLERSPNDFSKLSEPFGLKVENVIELSEVLSCGENFEIAKRLLNGPKSCVELGKELNVDAESLNRVLRVMSSVGAFVEIDDMVYENNDVSLDMIQCEHFCKLLTEDVYQEGFKRIGKSVKEGCVNPVSFDGTDIEFYDFVEKNQEFKELFHKAMGSFNTKCFPLIANKINFNEFETIVDIGGSQGHLLLTILEKHNQVKKAINFDLPTVIEKNSVLEETRKKKYSNQVLSRFEEVGGSFFDSVPSGADVYLMGSIFHNWSNEKSKEILSTISKAMKKDSKIFIFENIISAKNTPNMSVLLDIVMMVAHCGLERSPNDFTKLSEPFGLKVEKVLELSEIMSCYFEIAKRLLNGPKSCVELGKELNVDAESLNRVLRVMSSVGAFVEIDDMVYENNDVSLDMIQYEYFCKLITQDIYQEGFKRIGKSVKEGCVNPVSFDGTGLEFYNYVDKTPEFKKLFHKAMESFNSNIFPTIAGKINFNEFETIVDIGGSQGHLLLTILEKHNQVKKAINFDLPTVIEKNSLLVETRKKHYSNDILSRFEEVGGSFFDTVPSGADTYLLRNILHNWSNEKSKEILSTISKAMKKDSKIFIFENIVNSKNIPNLSVSLDLVMMVAHGGLERSPNDFSKLSEPFGLKVENSSQSTVISRYILEIDDKVYQNNQNSLDLIKYKSYIQLIAHDLFYDGIKGLGDWVLPNAMETYNVLDFKTISDGINFNKFETIVDLGGSQGHLLLIILENHNQVKKAINFDLPTVIENNFLLFETRKKRFQNQVLSRFEEVGGSFLEYVPSNADVYILRNILHNWSDDQSKSILCNIVKAMKPTSKILIFESILESKNQPNMMIFFGGKERSILDFQKLSEMVGLKVENVMGMKGNFSCVVLIKQ